MQLGVFDVGVFKADVCYVILFVAGTLHASAYNSCLSDTSVFDTSALDESAFGASAFGARTFGATAVFYPSLAIT